MMESTTSNAKSTDELSAKAKLEAERMQDVLLLLEHLVRQEETTVKLIIDCLYDIGSINVIEQKLRSQTLRRSSKFLARQSKPLVKTVAIRWVKRNCPKLIADWLYLKVAFKPPVTKKEKQVAEVAAIDPNPSIDKTIATVTEAVTEAVTEVSASSKTPPVVSEVDRNTVQRYTQEVDRLRSQIKLLRGLLVGSVLVLGSTVAWLIYTPTPEESRAKEPTQPIAQPIRFDDQPQLQR
ncbi:MAG: hypothetical protein HC881_09955 [Leptolyngbyaceae cyanobacterium SL_7_1]|nr:hypothetical protein [Leptolyngbyaceae cyanobacterium SL_7_1]